MGIAWGHFLLFIITDVGTKYREFRKSIPFSLLKVHDIRTSIAGMFRIILKDFDVSRAFSKWKINMDVFDDNLRKRFLKNADYFESMECRHGLAIVYRHFMYNFDAIMHEFLQDLQLHMISS
jgi:hypothetical protein